MAEAALLVYFLRLTAFAAGVYGQISRSSDHLLGRHTQYVWLPRLHTVHRSRGEEPRLFAVPSCMEIAL